MTEQERAEQLAQALDQAMQRQNALGSEAPALPPADQALLQLAQELATHSAFAPTPAEQAQLRRRFEEHKAAQRKQKLPRLLRPVLQSAGWAALLLGIFAVIGMLLANLLGKPANPTAGPALTAAAQGTPAQPVASATPNVTPTPQPVTLNPNFPPQSQPVNGLHMELRDVVSLGSSLRA